MFIKSVLMLFYLVVIIVYTNGDNILAITPIASHSHSIWHRVLLKELHTKGHNITILGVDNEPNDQNYTFILMEDIYEQLRVNFDLENLPSDPFDTLLSKWAEDLCLYGLKSNGFKTIMKYPKHFFDIIIIDIAMGNACFYPLIARLGNPPIIGTSAFGHSLRLVNEAGGFIYPAIVPHYSLPYTNRMSFWERFYNFVVQLHILITNQYFSRPRLQDAIADFYDSQDLRQIKEIEKNFTIIFVNSDSITMFPQPLMPNVISVAGIHIKTTNKLPEDIKEFLDNAKNGAILFSLGSNVQSNLLSENKRNILLAAFSKLPYRILWKWESDSLPGKPENVMIKKWVPQCDVLNHPNLKLFFSHSGLLSTQEAIYYHVPIVGMPFFYDQIYNIHRAVTKGIAMELDFKTITEEKIIKTITEVITNPKYQKNINVLSEQLRDQHETPLERAVFWVERTLRYRGGHHFQSASVHLSAFKAYCLDIITVILLFIVAIFYTLYKMIKIFIYLIKIILCKLKKESDSKKKIN